MQQPPTPDQERAGIVQQITQCSPQQAAKAIRRLAEYGATLASTDTVPANSARFNLPTQTAAVLCGVSKHTFLKYAGQYPDELPYLRLGIAFRFCRADVLAFIRRRVQGMK